MTSYFVMRKDENSQIEVMSLMISLAHRCGLFLKLHGVPRPKIFATQPVGARGRTQTGAAAQAAASLTPPSCANCEVTSTPMWRKDSAGLLTCNA